MVRTQPILRNLGMIIAIRIYQKALAAVARGESLTKASKITVYLVRILPLQCSETRSLKIILSNNYVTIIRQTYPMERWMHGLCVKDVGLRRLAFELCSEASIHQPQHKVMRQSLDEGMI